MQIEAINNNVIVDGTVIASFDMNYEARACAEQLKLLNEEDFIEALKGVKSNG